MNSKQTGISSTFPDAATPDALLRLAFNNSLVANIVTIAGNGKIIMVNKAACKLLGYPKKELLTKSRATIFKAGDQAFKKMLKERTVDGHSSALLRVIRKSGKLIPCEITSAVFTDHGVNKAITSIVDKSGSILKQKIIDTANERKVSADIASVKLKQEKIDIQKEKTITSDIDIALAKSDARIEENNEWIEYIAKASYDVMWDWDIASGELYVGDSIEEIFGYKVPGNIMQFKEFTRHFLPAEKNNIEKKLLKAIASADKVWSDAFLFRRFDGSVASTVSRAGIIRDEKGKAIRLIGAIQDISKLQELEKIVAGKVTMKIEQKGIFQLAAKLSYDGIWDWNLLTNDFFLGEGFRDLFGYEIKTGRGSMADWSKHLHPDDKVAVEKGLAEAIASSATRWEHTYRFIRSDGSIAEVFGRASIVRDKNGAALRMIGAVHDISKQRVLEAKLEQEIKLKESQIAEATKDAKDTERSDIGRELHDNVNQLLAASKMYLDMAKGGGDSSPLFISRSSEFTIKAIEEIRKLSKGLTHNIINNLGLCPALENIIRDMMEVNKIKITFSCNRFIEDSVNNKFKLTVYRIVQEHLNNIFKHARAVKIGISLSQDSNSVILKITDNGIGFDTTKKRSGIGVQNIKSRATSYNGKASFISRPGKGCVLKVLFPIALLQSLPATECI